MTPPMNPDSRKTLSIAYAVEGLNAGGVSLLAMGIFFYTTQYYHFSALQNLLLAAVQGAGYVGGSLLASPLSRRLRPRTHLLAIQLLLTLIATAALLSVATASFIVPLIVLYIFISSGSWPILESLVSAGAEAKVLSRRISAYNLTWSGVNAVAFALSGWLIAFNAKALFVVPLALHVLSAVVLLAMDRSASGGGAHASATPEPTLLRQRKLAMWLGRIALPAAFVVTYSLGAMLPSLPLLARFEPAHKTALASLWLVGRWLMFLYLGFSVAWHTRPRLLLIAAFILLGAFLGVVLRPSSLAGLPPALDMPVMLIAQLALGAAMAMIFCASLYFGMVLSSGSAEHGAYHEALIGVGQVVGPAVGALGQWTHPGDLRYGIASVAALVALSCLAAAVATYRFGNTAPASEGALA